MCVELEPRRLDMAGVRDVRPLLSDPMRHSAGPGAYFGAWPQPADPFSQRHAPFLKKAGRPASELAGRPAFYYSQRTVRLHDVQRPAGLRLSRLLIFIFVFVLIFIVIEIF